jgi:hypothetical protein
MPNISYKYGDLHVACKCSLNIYCPKIIIHEWRRINIFNIKFGCDKYWIIGTWLPNDMDMFPLCNIVQYLLFTSVDNPWLRHSSHPQEKEGGPKINEKKSPLSPPPPLLSYTHYPFRNPTVWADSHFRNPTVRASSAGPLKRETVPSDGHTHML